MTEKFNVTGMTCSACSAHVEKSVKKLDGVKSVNVNLLQNNMHVDFDTVRLLRGKNKKRKTTKSTMKFQI